MAAKTSDSAAPVSGFFRRERCLLLALLALVALLNVPYGGYLLYPFTLFSTWVHELCHGLAALALGGSIDRLLIYPDGSGLAWTRRPETRFAAAFVASAGYVGTSLVGAALLLARGRKMAGRIGVGLIGVAMLLSDLLLVRNLFGFAAVLLIGAALLLAARKLSDPGAAWLFTFLAATCCLNAITSIRTLFGAKLVVNGAAVSGSDANTVAEALLLPSWIWASLWLILALLVTGASLRFGGGQSRANHG